MQEDAWNRCKVVEQEAMFNQLRRWPGASDNADAFSVNEPR
jgi:hypothetical protein